MSDAIIKIYASQDWVENAIANIPEVDMSEYATETYVDDAISELSSQKVSWNDIEDKPFYDEIKEAVLLNGDIDTSDVWVTYDSSFSLIEGEEYMVVCDGVEYRATAQISDDGSVYCGSASLWNDEEYTEAEEPFSFGSGFFVAYPFGEHTVRVSGKVTEHRNIDSGFLPGVSVKGIDPYTNEARDEAIGAFVYNQTMQASEFNDDTVTFPLVSFPICIDWEAGGKLVAVQTRSICSLIRGINQNTNLDNDFSFNDPEVGKTVIISRDLILDSDVIELVSRGIGGRWGEKIQLNSDSWGRPNVYACLVDNKVVITGIFANPVSGAVYRYMLNETGENSYGRYGKETMTRIF